MFTLCPQTNKKKVYLIFSHKKKVMTSNQPEVSSLTYKEIKEKLEKHFGQPLERDFSFEIEEFNFVSDRHE